MVAKVLPMTKRIENVVTELESENLIPKAYRNYVPFGNFDDLLQVIASKMFYPVFITGQSGNGKTMSVEQACAKLGRKFVCISMTPETDESDLLGNFVLIDGQMVWRDGPVTVAARQGAVLCIDEVDYGAQNLAALQRVLEGKPFLLKKKNEVVTPTEGFTIIATANTKGKGSEDGRYMFTNILNEAFLERFPMTMEQDWAPNAVEKKILRKELNSVNRTDDTFADNLVTWAEAIRRTFADGGCDEVISTRRLVHIAKAYGIYGDRIKAITFCLNRFDTDTKISFIDLYTKIDAGVNVSDAKPAEEVQPKPNPNEEVAF
jgi:MoxR-like ATPase